MISTVSPATVAEVRWGVVAFLSVLALRGIVRSDMPARSLLARVPRCVVGLSFFGVGIALFFAAGVGNAPWDVFHGGLARKVGLPVGLVINLVGIAVLALWIPLRERVGLGTVLNTLVIGVVVDLVRTHLGDARAPILQALLVLGGVAAIGVGSGLYIGAGLGAGPRDGVMLGLSRFGLSIRAARWLTESVTLLAGLALGGRIGAGTVAFLVLIGPVVQFLLPRLGLPPLVLAGPIDSSDGGSHRGLIGEHYRS